MREGRMLRQGTDARTSEAALDTITQGDETMTIDLYALTALLVSTYATLLTMAL